MSEIDERLGMLSDRIAKAETLWDGLKIAGPGWVGDVDQGYVFNPEPTADGKPKLTPLPDGTITIVYDIASTIGGTAGGFGPIVAGSPSKTYSFYQSHSGPPPTTNGTQCPPYYRFLHSRVEIVDATGNDFDDETYTKSYIDQFNPYPFQGNSLRSLNLIHHIVSGGSGYTGTDPITTTYTRDNLYTGPAMRADVFAFGLPPFPNTFATPANGFFGDAYAPGGAYYDPTFQLFVPPSNGVGNAWADRVYVDQTPSGTFSYLVNTIKYKITKSMFVLPNPTNVNILIKWNEGIGPALVIARSEIIPAGKIEGKIHTVAPPTQDRVYSGFNQGTSHYNFVSGPPPIFIWGLKAYKQQ